MNTATGFIRCTQMFVSAFPRGRWLMIFFMLFGFASTAQASTDL